VLELHQLHFTAVVLVGLEPLLEPLARLAALLISRVLRAVLAGV
jgi:hypothetical protein